jgi:hypothetical protein
MSKAVNSKKPVRLLISAPSLFSLARLVLTVCQLFAAAAQYLSPAGTSALFRSRPLATATNQSACT